MNVFDHTDVGQQGDIIYDAIVAGMDLLTPVYKVPVKYGS